ncbi:MAG TPA: universal stress protein [Acidobacteriaceae bacterium]|nr:universal stress protein [Acidobacteriaceae bacterium]
MPQATGTTDGIPIRLKRILFATDFSPTSAMALPYAAAIARRFRSTIYVAHVIHADEYAHIEPILLDATLHQMKLAAEERIKSLLASSHFNKIPFQLILDHGDAMAVIATLVDKHNIDLIVAGSHGRHGLHKLLSPSVEEAITGAAACPALLIGPEASIEPKAEVHLKSMLFATDFSPASRRAMHYAYALAKVYAAHLYVFHVAEDVWNEPLSTRMSADAFCRMRLLERGWPQGEQGVEPEFLVDFGPPETLILEAAAKRAVQLIVVGIPETAHPHLASHLPGPLAYNLASHSLCPVLAVRSAAHGN